MTKLASPLRLASLALGGALVWTAQPLGAQSVGPSLPAPVPQRDCEGDPTSPSEVVVCGRRRGESPFRIPPALRRGQTDEDPSWSAQTRDAIETQRYEGQAVGPGGALQRSRETDCRWRAERQQLRGEQIDCSRSIRPAVTD